MVLLFACTLFLSATLLFWVQPMIAKMLLPLLGGSPSVWNTCMVFFQAALLLGYLYAHWSSRRSRFLPQVLLQALLLGGAAFFLPMAVSEARLQRLAEGASPNVWLLTTLFFAAGAPFFILASTAPLLQRWFSESAHPRARDPYFLYSASNLGSLLALVSYPVLLEPFLPVQGQTLLWTIGYAVLGGVTILCGWRSWNSRRAHRFEPSCLRAARGSDSLDQGPGPSWRRRAYWILLAAVPSSLMLGVTSFLTTDIASIPLLWVIPLALYLFSFVIVFARRKRRPHGWAERLMPFSALALVYLLITRTTEPAWLLVALHLSFFFLAALICHGRLAADRPSPRHLTDFYLCMSVGGMVGGLFNAVLAPQLFQSVLEYPIAIVLACLLLPRRQHTPAGEGRIWPVILDTALPVALGLVTLVLSHMVTVTPGPEGAPKRLLAAGLPAGLTFLLASRPWRFGLGVAAVLCAGWSLQAPAGSLLQAERNFYGISRVEHDPQLNMNRLVHGNTFHGRQFEEESRRCEPLAYYHRRGPFAEVVAAYQERASSPHVAVIGLGCGAMAAYIHPGEHWSFYELDPAVIRIAQDTNLFTYLSSCAEGTWNIVAGDARLRLQEAPERHYGMIVLDAFSSDAIPVHLLTREALTLYRSKLAPGGILAVHISNRYLDLGPVMADLAADAGWIGRSWNDQFISPEEALEGKAPSHWVVLAERTEDLGSLHRLANWSTLQGRPGHLAWRDDFSNILGAMRWR